MHLWRRERRSCCLVSLLLVCFDVTVGDFLNETLLPYNAVVEVYLNPTCMLDQYTGVNAQNLHDNFLKDAYALYAYALPVGMLHLLMKYVTDVPKWKTLFFILKNLSNKLQLFFTQ